MLFGNHLEQLQENIVRSLDHDILPEAEIRNLLAELEPLALHMGYESFQVVGLNSDVVNGSFSFIFWRLIIQMGSRPTDVHPVWIPEFFGDVMLVNGKVWPYLEVEPRKYRFRFLNGAQARFFSLALAERMSGAPGPAFHQIGTDGGYLAEPELLNDPSDPHSPRLIIAPGERADVVIDFAG